MAYMSYAIFNTPAGKPYIETYLIIQGSSLHFEQNADKKYTGSVNVRILFRKVSDSSIVNFNKYVINSPETADTVDAQFNLIDVQRYSISNGNYFIELNISDKNTDKPPYVNYEKFSVQFADSSAVFSDIELLNGFEVSNDSSLLVKNGLKLMPYIFSYFPASQNKLSFYSELYGSGKSFKSGKYLLQVYIRPFEVDKKLDNYFYMKKVDTSAVNVILNTFNIADLPTGNYYLVFEARNRNNKIVATKHLFFQRNNPRKGMNLNGILSTNVDNTFAIKITNRDSLVEYIKYINPISTDLEKSFTKSQIKSADLLTLQKYFLNFWIERNHLHPLLAWRNYKHLVDQANHDFKTIALKGYQTDRGRVYLQYGPPNVITKSYYEPAAYPYEIWHYYRLGYQRNKKFVFYTHDLVTNDFQLIHSDAVGELANYRWQTFIYQRTWDPNNIDQTQPPDAWGNDASDYYYHPR